MTHLQTYANAFDGKQRDLAEAFGISRAYLSLLLAGKKRPSLELAIRIERITKSAVPVTCWIDDNRTGGV
jgi:transcriptional regulator with XRE-family HTH domain